MRENTMVNEDSSDITDEIVRKRRRLTSLAWDYYTLTLIDTEKRRKCLKSSKTSHIYSAITILIRHAHQHSFVLENDF